MAPLHYRSPESPDEWLDVDVALEPDEGWRHRSGNVPVHLPAVLGAGKPLAAGPGFGIRWTPGSLRARLLNGEEVELALPQPAAGSAVAGRTDSVLYQDLYPGIDLWIEVRPGALLLTTLLKSFPFDVDPREIEALVLDAGLEVEPQLLQAMEQGMAEGGELADLPLHFGTAEDEFVITLASPGGARRPEPDPSRPARSPDSSPPAGSSISWTSILKPSRAGNRRAGLRPAAPPSPRCSASKVKRSSTPSIDCAAPTPGRMPSPYATSPAPIESESGG